MSVPTPEGHEDAIAAVLRSLAASAARANLARSAVLAAAVGAAETGQLREQLRAEAAAAAHQVLGSAGTFGSPGASRAAAVLEDFFLAVAPVRENSVPADASRARQALDELNVLLAEGPHRSEDEAG